MKNKTKLAVALVALVLAGCATERTYTTAPVITRNPADVALEDSLQAQLSRYGDLAAVSSDVHFHANNGLVTITGAVRDERDRQMVDALCRSTAGVVEVNDQMVIAGAPAVAPEAAVPVVTTRMPPVVVQGTVIHSSAPYMMVQAATGADEPIAGDIVVHLQRDSVPAMWLRDATITVSGGNVYLQGSVHGRPQRDAIVAACQYSHGVGTVYDQLDVRQ